MSFLYESSCFDTLFTDKRLNENEFSLKRKRDFNDVDDEDDEDNEDDNETNYVSNHPKKNVKNDELLSKYNIKPYRNPLLIIDKEIYDEIDRRIDYLHKLHNLQIDNSKKINTNIKTIYRYSITQFNDIHTKIDLLNTKMNRIDADIIDMTQTLCLKIEKLEKEIKKSN